GPQLLAVDQVVDLRDVRGRRAGECLPVDSVRQGGETVERRGHRELCGTGSVYGCGRALRACGCGENYRKPCEPRGQAPQPMALAACSMTIHPGLRPVALVASGHGAWQKRPAG